MSKEFTITFCGDTSLGYYYLEQGKDKYPEAYQRLQSDPMSFFSGVAPLLEGSNEIIVNLETVLSTNPGNPIEGKQYPGCDDPETTISILKKLGVTAVTLANNHSMDFGPEAMLGMIDFLHANGIATIGAGRNIAEARKPYIITLPGTGKKVYVINGMRARRRYIEYGFFATKDKPGIANTRFASVKRQIERIKSTDPESTVVVCPHWQGIDYKDVDATKKQWCRDIVDAGADLIVGHGTHKKDTVEEYSGKKIYYSIGNFVFNSPGRYRSMGADPESMVVSFELDKQGSMEAEAARICTNNRITKFITRPINNISKNDDVVAASSVTFEQKKESTKLFRKERVDLRGNIFSLNEKALERMAKELPAELTPAALKSVANLTCEIESKVYHYYKGLFKNKSLKSNSGNEELVSLAANTINKKSVDYQMQRKFSKRKRVVRDVISFHDLILESRSARLLGCRDYGAMIDKKDIAYKFADKIGVRRPTLFQICKFSEIEEPASPVVIKPTRATGSMGVYLYYSKDKILSAREGNWLSSWNELLTDLSRKISADGARERKYFTKDEWMVEELITSGNPENPVASDIKFYSFYGEVLLILESNPAIKKFCFWDQDLNIVDTGQYSDKSYIGKGVSKEQLAIGCEMSKLVPAPYMRFDMLKGKDELVFCEATFYPGNFHAFNDEWDYKLGEAYIKAKGRILEDLLSGKSFSEFKQSVGMK